MKTRVQLLAEYNELAAAGKKSFDEGNATKLEQDMSKFFSWLNDLSEEEAFVVREAIQEQKQND